MHTQHLFEHAFRNSGIVTCDRTQECGGELMIGGPQLLLEALPPVVEQGLLRGGEETLEDLVDHGRRRRDSADVTIWQDNVGATWSALTGAGGGGLALSETVPEPCGFLLAVLGTIGGVALRRRELARMNLRPAAE